jgi:CHAD domain-containing protein
MSRCLILDELEKSVEVPFLRFSCCGQTIEQERQSLHSELRSRLERFDVDKFRKRAVATVPKRTPVDRTARKNREPLTANAPAQRRAERLTFAIDNAAGLYLPDRLHEVRIAVKKLRYALELARSVGGSRATGRIRTLKSAQDLLGRMHDLEVLIARTRSIQSSPGRSSLKMSADLDRLVRRLENECRQLHGQYMNLRRRLTSLSGQLTSRQRRSGARHSAA